MSSTLHCRQEQIGAENRSEIPGISVCLITSFFVCLLCAGCIGFSGAPAITPSQLPAARVGVPYATTLTASGGSAPYRWSIVSGALPPGLNFNIGTGELSGTPTQIGSFKFMVQLLVSSSPSFKAAERSISLNVDPPSPQITTSVLANAQTGIQYQGSVTAIGGVQPFQWSIASGHLPPGLSLNAASGMLSATPSQGGQFDFSVQVSDSSSPKPQTAMKALTLSVLAFALQINSGGLPNGQIGVPFQASVSGSGGVTPYTWTVVGALPSGLSLNASSGAIAGTPTQGGASTFTIKFTDSSQQTTQKALSITILAAGVQPLLISTTTLPNLVTGQAYSATLQATGGTPPYTWSVASGQLPPGLTLGSASGQIVGTSSQVGSSTVSIQASDSAGQTAQKSFSIMIAPAGPALPALPQATVDITMPIQSGTVRNVPAGDAAGFQAAINAATCGDTIVLVAGSTYKGAFTIPNKVCAGWILIQSSALAGLPPRGKRVGPSNVSNMAKIVASGADVNAITFQASSHNWRLIGLEVTSPGGVHEYSLIETDVAATLVSQEPSFIIIDRCYLHGALASAVRRGFSLQGPSMAVVDSYFNEFHDQRTSPGVGADSQAIASYNTPGPVLIQNNFLSGASENVIFGGADPKIVNQVASDITIVGNWFWKDYANWLGAGMVVKNLVEFKNAQRILLDGNVVEYSWGDAQVGYAILLTVRNQDGLCTWCAVQDVTITHNLIRHAASGIETTGSDNVHPSQKTNRILIQNNVLTDIDETTWNGGGIGFLTVNFSSGINLPGDNIKIDHNDVFASTSLWVMGDDTTASNYQFTNNLSLYGVYGIIGTDHGSGSSSLNFFFTPNLTHNKIVLLTATGASDGNTWPTGTFWNTTAGAGFTNYAGASYQLQSTSAYYQAGTDGKDIGVWDWSTFNTETTNALNGNYP